MIDSQYYQYLEYARVLQDYFVDKDSGLPLSGGQITFYVDDGGTTPKTVYYQTGTSPPYSYTALPNPVTLTSVGTIADGSGNDVIPYFFPYDETQLPSLIPQGYRVQCISATSINQWTRYNFAGPLVEVTPGSAVQTLQNILINNGFWRSLTQGVPISVNTALNTLVAPGMHDGFNIDLSAGNSDIRFIKDANSISTTFDTVGIIDLSGEILPNGVNIAQGFEYICSQSATGGGEVTKALQIPITLDIDNLSLQQYTIAFWGKCVSGNNIVTPKILQFLGTTNPATAPIPQVLPGQHLTNNWALYAVTSTFPSGDISGKSLAGDDALFLQLNMPLNAVTDIQIAAPCLFLGNSIPTNYFQTYDEVNSIICAPRTGDIRMSLGIWSFNTFPTVGWVPMTDGTIGSINSDGMTIDPQNYASEQSWQLYQMIWNSFIGNQSAAPMYSVGVVPTPIPPGTPTNTISYGLVDGTAYGDFIHGNKISLPKVFGRVISSVGTPQGVSGASTKLLGIFEGEQAHTQLISEMPSHNHPGSYVVTSTPNFNGGVSPDEVFGGSNNHALTIASQGGGSPFNVIQPTNYFNFFMKL